MYYSLVTSSELVYKPFSNSGTPQCYRIAPIRDGYNNDSHENRGKYGKIVTLYLLIYPVLPDPWGVGSLERNGEDKPNY